MQIRLAGVRECLAQLTRFPAAIQRKHTRIAMNAGGGIIKRSAELLVPVRTKLLKQALGVKVTQRKNGDWYAVVGAKRGMKRAVRLSRSGTMRAMSKRSTSNLKFTPGGNRVTRIDPARYLHLVEKGTRSHVVTVKNAKVLAGNGGVWGRKVQVGARRSGFMRMAAQTGGSAAVQKAVRKLQEAIVFESRYSSKQAGLTAASRLR